MTKQSAVSWLINELHKKQNGVSSNLSYNQLFDQAKEMEKKNIIDAYVEGCEESYGLDNPNPECDDKTYAEQYYNQTFKPE
jgi:hypothetical protein